MVVVSIGGNDFNFASIVQQCVTDFLASPSWWKDYCNDDCSVTANFTAANVAAVAGPHRHGVRRTSARPCATRATPTAAGRCSCRTTPRRSRRGSGFRYGESGYTRQSTGGCGFWNADADWANNTALPTINSGGDRRRDRRRDRQPARPSTSPSAFNGRRLCENTVGLYEEKGLTSWTQAGAVDKTEWVNQIRTVSTCCSNSPYYIQESLHPNYWAQLATRSCVRQAWNGGATAQRHLHDRAAPGWSTASPGWR